MFGQIFLYFVSFFLFVAGAGSATQTPILAAGAFIASGVFCLCAVLLQLFRKSQPPAP